MVSRETGADQTILAGLETSASLQDFLPSPSSLKREQTLTMQSRLTSTVSTVSTVALWSPPRPCVCRPVGSAGSSVLDSFPGRSGRNLGFIRRLYQSKFPIPKTQEELASEVDTAVHRGPSDPRCHHDVVGGRAPCLARLKAQHVFEGAGYVQSWMECVSRVFHSLFSLYVNPQALVNLCSRLSGMRAPCLCAWPSLSRYPGSLRGEPRG